MRVKALQKVYYGRQDRYPGDVYEMDDREEAEAKVLALIGKIEVLSGAEARPARVEEVPPAPRYEAADLRPEEVELGEEGQQTERRRYYRRRDMRATE